MFGPATLLLLPVGLLILGYGAGYVSAIGIRRGWRVAVLSGVLGILGLVLAFQAPLQMTLPSKPKDFPR